MPNTERLSESAVQETFNLCDSRRMTCRDVCPLWEKVPNEAVRVLIHTAFPCTIGHRKEGLGVQDAGDWSVSSTFFTVVVADGLDVGAQRFQAVRGCLDRISQRRDGGAPVFALDMDEQCPAPPQVTPEVTAL